MTHLGRPARSSIPKPVIVGFLCSWCAYRAADLVGMLRSRDDLNIRSIRIMCSGRVDPTLIMKAFRDGADGVMVAGCHPGECHYVDGNLKTLRRIILLRQMLTQWGIEEDRLEFVWVAASEGAVLTSAAARMVERLRVLGPLGWSLNGPLIISQFGDSPTKVGRS